jgi:ATP-dependent helicase/nuclease subunit B
VITPRRTRLVRVADLQGLRASIAGLVNTATTPALVVVPTREAARQLRRCVPDADGVTRDELYDRLHARLTNPPRRLNAIERDVLAQAAARAAAAAGIEVSFQLRPGLVAEMLRFYDQLRRQSQQVQRFEELIGDALGSDELDRAALRMRRQTQFLAETFREYERRVHDSAACDEHVLRDRLIAEAAAVPIRHVIVTVADWIADVEGLYVADFDLLSRIPGLESLDLVGTEAVLGSGFHERLHNWWPGIEEVSHGTRSSKPVLVTPPDALPEQPWWTYRDREEELVGVARHVKEGQRAGDAAPLERTAVVFKRPLPYLYVAPEIFRGADIPYQTAAALPLASEPTAAALDLVLSAVASRFTRDAIVALLRSPHFVFRWSEVEIARPNISALDRALSEARYLGDPDRLAALASEWRSARSESAVRVALAIAEELAPLASPRPASRQIRTLLDFWVAHIRPLAGDEMFTAREGRARAAIVELLSMLAAVHEAQDDPSWTVDDLGIAVRRGIEEHTFVAESAGAGIHLLDDQAVRYGDFDEVTILGVIDPDWPDRPRRTIFYPPALLKSLGWPSEKDRRAAADARFLDLLAAASKRTSVSTFTLDDDALVSRSMQLDEIPRARLSSVARMTSGDARVFDDDALSIEPAAPDTLAPDVREWAELRAGRTAAEAPEFHGAIGPPPPRAWSVSALETYLDCPFKFFAQRVLKLEEEPEDEEVMDPRRQGQFVHEVFEKFFSAWQRAGHRAITRDNLADAGDLFTQVVDEALERLPAAEAGLERTRLLGSSAAAGLGDAVLRMEAERPVAVVERMLEHELTGEFTFAASDGTRTVALRGKADRLDLLADGTFRLIDYKLGWPPNRTRALQLPIYGLCAEQRLVAYRGRQWVLGEAVYLAFKGPRRVVPLYISAADRARVLAEAQQRLVDTVDAIAAGEFPPRPDDVWRCETCSFAAVCRKDYVGDV